MLAIKEYNRQRAVEYAARWAFDRSPLFESYNGIGGDCTNFISQCVYAGSCVMNYIRDFGWYYISPTNRAPAWTGVEFFYNFLTGNDGVGPFAEEVSEGLLQEGDVIQLGGEDGDYYHTLIVTGFEPNGYLVSAHSNDAFDRPLYTYDYTRIRFLHILGVRFTLPDNSGDCFENFIGGVSL